MDEQDGFESWWQTLNVYDPVVKAFAGSAWMEAIRASKPIPQGPSYHEKQKPQPQKKMLRLWIDPYCNVHAGLKNDGDLELHYDHETRQFYTEEQR